jgi:hypothetical protein
MESVQLCFRKTKKKFSGFRMGGNGYGRDEARKVHGKNKTVSKLR